MGGKIHKYDTYDLRKWGPYDVATFVDIGANCGTVSIMARILFPDARIIAIEPCRETFSHLQFYMNWGVECYNFAMGDGTELSFQKGSHSGLNQFSSSEEASYSKGLYRVPSQTLPNIFKAFNVVPPYILKIDCEGGERFLLNDPACKDVVRGSLQTCMELHKYPGVTSQQWRDWLKDIETHQLLLPKWEKHGDKYKCGYVPVDLLPSNYSDIQLLRKP